MFSQLFKRKKPVVDVDKKKHLADHGYKLSLLKESDFWPDLLLVKEHFQEDAGMRAVNAGTDDKARFAAAIEYSIMHAFFMEISRRIRVGEEAAKELQGMVKK